MRSSPTTRIKWPLMLLSLVSLAALVHVDSVVGGQSRMAAAAVSRHPLRPGSGPRLQSKPPSVIETLREMKQFTIFLKALEAVGMIESLEKTEDCTVFAPTDEAFNKLPPKKLEDLMKAENKESLGLLLSYHISPFPMQVSEVAKIKGRYAILRTGGPGAYVTVDARGEKLKVNKATIMSNDIVTSNGFLQVIDAVLDPKDPNP